MESYIDYSHPLPNSEYTSEVQITISAHELTPVYSVLRKYVYNNFLDMRKDIADQFKKRYILDMINDLRRIIAYYNEKSLKCVNYIEAKYIDFEKYGVLRDVFLLCLKSLITNNIIAKNSTFSILLNPIIKFNYLLDDDTAHINQSLEDAYSIITTLPSTTKTTDEVKDQQDVVVLDNNTEERVLENYNFWTGLPKPHCINIFENISVSDFLKMVTTADFTVVHTKGQTQRVKYNVYLLSRLLGAEWGDTAAQKLKTTLVNCIKRTLFNEIEANKFQLKTMFLQ